MKKYLLGVFAVVLAVGFSAFTKTEAPKVEKKQSTIVFLVYNSGSQSLIGSYSQVVNPSTPPTCPGATRLCAIRVVDNDGVVTQAEFNPIFTSLDATPNGTLDDQAETTTLLKKS